MIQFRRLVGTPLGRVFMSLLLGLGIAALFRAKCVDRECIDFRGPVIDRVHGKVFRFGDDQCSRFLLVPARRDPAKKTVRIRANEEASSEPAVGGAS